MCLWTATLRTSGRPVVVKLLPTWGAEASKLDLLAKDLLFGVIPVLAHKLTVCAGYSGIVMPRLNTFFEVLEQLREHPTDANAGLVVQGLDWLVESRRWVHGDLTPDNFGVCRSTRKWHLLDVESAGQLPASADSMKLMWNPIHTVGYAAPELVSAAGATVHVNTDMYSVGVIAREAAQELPEDLALPYLRLATQLTLENSQLRTDGAKYESDIKQ